MNDINLAQKESMCCPKCGLTSTQSATKQYCGKCFIATGIDVEMVDPDGEVDRERLTTILTLNQMEFPWPNSKRISL